MTVDIDKLKALLAVLKEENVSEFEHESEGVRIRLVRGGVAPLAAMMHVGAGHAPSAAPAAIAETPADSVDVTSVRTPSVWSSSSLRSRKPSRSTSRTRIRRRSAPFRTRLTT